MNNRVLEKKELDHQGSAGTGWGIPLASTGVKDNGVVTMKDFDI
jgi:hypothetical protein